MNLALWILFGYLFIYIGRLVKGPTIWDRLMVMNIVSTKIIIIIIIFASLNELAYLLDFAIIYALFGFIGTVFIALFLAGKSSRKKE